MAKTSFAVFLGVKVVSNIGLDMIIVKIIPNAIHGKRKKNLSQPEVHNAISLVLLIVAGLLVFCLRQERRLDNPGTRTC